MTISKFQEYIGHWGDFVNFGLTGNPLGHSLSKVIHLELFKIKNVDFTYELLPTENLEKLFSEQLSSLDGFNVTIPYKTDILDFLNNMDDKVKLYNACNTVVNREGVFTGYNTDVYGFLNTLKNCNVTLENKKVLVLGSGGVSRMMVFESALNGAKVYITSRNRNKCEEIKEEVKEKTGFSIHIINEDEVKDEFDIVLNGTPCGMFPNFISLPINFEKIINVPFVFDTIYNPRETLLTKLTKYCGNKAKNGLYMLVEQAAVAQKLFCGLEYSDEEVQSVVDKISIKPICLNKNIILIGPPGSGKSTIGKELADIFGLDFVDTDAEIVRIYGNISEIFEKHGESHFRQLEREILGKFMNKSNLLISTGGGIVVNSEIMENLCSDSNNIVVFINPSFDILLNRTSKSNDRPLLADDLACNLKKLLNDRLPLYNKYSNVKLDINEEQDVKLTTIQCVDKICLYEKMRD